MGNYSLFSDTLCKALLRREGSLPREQLTAPVTRLYLILLYLNTARLKAHTAYSLCEGVVRTFQANCKHELQLGQFTAAHHWAVNCIFILQLNPFIFAHQSRRCGSLTELWRARWVTRIHQVTDGVTFVFTLDPTETPRWLKRKSEQPECKRWS